MKPTVFLMLGLPGSGKTTYSKRLEKELGMTRFSLDEEYAKLGGDLDNHRWNEQIAMEANELIKSRVKELVDQNKSVLLDFCPWKKGERQAYRTYIESLGATCRMYYFEVSKTELNHRLATREKGHVVTPDMLDTFIERFDPPVNENYESVQV